MEASEASFAYMPVHDRHRWMRPPPAPLVAARFLSLARWPWHMHAPTADAYGWMDNRSCIVRVDPGHGCGQVEPCRLQQATMILKAREVIGDLEGMLLSAGWVLNWLWARARAGPFSIRLYIT